MPINFEEILKDTTKYGDATPIKFTDTDGNVHDVPLGSFRTLNARERQELAGRMEAATAKEQNLTSREREVVNNAKLAQEALESLQAARAALPNPTAGADPYADPWLAPVKKDFDARDKTIDELKKMVQSGQTTVTEIAKVWAQDRWKNQYKGLNFGKRDKPPTREELLKFSTEHKLNDEYGFPSVEKAWEEMSKGDRETELKQQEFERGKEAGRMEALVARVPQPGVPGMGSGAPPPKAAPGELPDLYAESMKDPELRAMMDELAKVGIQ
jgi:hypothetical protein